uniref:Uncharacterized protein n=1 Tax=Oryza punctata TaxID=4537 RepID=A0A0E0M161_ORYPU
MNTSWFYVVLFMERTLQLSKVTTVGRSGVMLGSSDVAPDEFCREVKVLLYTLPNLTGISGMTVATMGMGPESNG